MWLKSKDMPQRTRELYSSALAAWVLCVVVRDARGKGVSQDLAMAAGWYRKAAEQGELEALKVAIAPKYDPYEDERVAPNLDAPNKKGKLALHLALCNTKTPPDLAVAKVLLDAGASADARNGAPTRGGVTRAALCACDEGGAWPEPL